MEGKINATILLEILGRPVEHVKEALTTLVLKIGSENGVKIINKTLHDPKPVQDSKTLFTSFAEIDLELDSLDRYVMVLFTYMPSHTEIVHPEKILISNAELNEIGNTIVQRLHLYDAVTKNTIVEKTALIQKLKEVAPQLFSKKEPPPINPAPKKKTPKKKSKKKKN